MKTLSFLFTLLLVVACGGKDEATPEQKAKLREVNKSASAVMESGQSVGQQRGGRRVWNAGSSLDQSSSSDKARISRELQNADCDFNMSEPTASAQSMSIKIDGPQCPIAMEIGAKARSEKEAEMRIFFEIKSAELKRYSDVTRYEVSGPISEGGANLSGSITSQKYGQIGVEMKASGSNGSGTLEAEYKFSDFSISLKAEVNGKEVKYFINDKEASQEELADLLGGGKLAPGMKTLW